MPYQNIKQLSKQVSDLPVDAKKIFLKAFNSSYSKTGDDETAFKVAWSVVKKKYEKKKNKWIVKSSLLINSDVKKSGIFNPNYKFTAVLSGINKDYENNSVGELLLQKIANNIVNIDNSGDFDHLNYKGFNQYKGIFTKLKHWYDNGKLYFKFAIDKSHNKFNEVKELFKDKDIAEVSAEFYDPVIVNNKILHASKIGWSVCKDESAVNPEAKIVKVE